MTGLLIRRSLSSKIDSKLYSIFRFMCEMKFLSLLTLLIFVLVNLSPLEAGAGFYPGQVLPQSQAVNPPLLQGIKIYPDDPLKFDFVLDKGDLNISNKNISVEAIRLLKYFLSALTIPGQDLWVNLSPYEENRIIPAAFGLTEMGRDLLAQDYLLKQLTTALLFPKDKTGEKFWQKIYALAQKRYGTTDIPIDLINKVWIVPRKAVVYENAGAAYVTEARLEVILDKDYNASGLDMASEMSAMAVSVLREVVIPVIEKEVNEGSYFAHLRQVYHSLILATWYKMKMKQSVLSQEYADRAKTAGVSIANPLETHDIWKQYSLGFKTGAYSHISEDKDSSDAPQMPRKYFSGGFDLGLDSAMDIRPFDKGVSLPGFSERTMIIRTTLQIVPDNGTDGSQSPAPDAGVDSSLASAWSKVVGKDHLMFFHNGSQDQWLGVSGDKKKQVVRFIQQAIAGGWFWQEKYKKDSILFSIHDGRIDAFVGKRMKRHSKLTKRAEALIEEVRHWSKKQKTFIYRTDQEVLNLSDIHLGAGDAHDAFAGRLPELLNLLHIAAQEKQVVVLNGDILELQKNRYGDVYQAYQVFFEALARCDKVFYVAGNHDDVILKERLAKKRRHLARMAENLEITDFTRTRQLENIIREARARSRVRLTRARLPYGPVMDKEGHIWFDDSVLEMPMAQAVAYVQKMIADLNEDIGHKILDVVNKDRKDRMVISRYVVIVRPAAGQILHFEHGHVPDKFNNKQAGGSVLDNFMSALSNSHWGTLHQFVENDMFFPFMTFMIKNVSGFQLFLVSAQKKRIRQLGELWDALLPFLYPDLFNKTPLAKWKRYVVYGHTHEPQKPGEGFLGMLLQGETAWQYVNSGTWSNCNEWGRHDPPEEQTYTWITVDDVGVHLHEASKTALDQKGGIDLAPDRSGLQILTQESGNGLVFDPVSAREIRSAAGLSPLIIDIRPANTSLFVFLGL